MTTKAPTKERLAQVLHAAGLFNMERMARAGRYDDFESELATPIVQLVADLREAGREDLAKRAINGEWDCTKEESEAWAQGPDGQRAIRSLTKGQLGQ
jgi:hypothetical protein